MALLKYPIFTLLIGIVCCICAAFFFLPFTGAPYHLLTTSSNGANNDEHVNYSEASKQGITENCQPGKNRQPMKIFSLFSFKTFHRVDHFHRVDKFS
jgi:hypothetical protein